MVFHGAKGYVGAAAPSTRVEAEVVLVDAGFDPAAVAAALHDLLGLTITDFEALEAATPLVLYQSLDRVRAELVSRRIRTAGGFVELRAPRQPHPGLKLRGMATHRRAA